MQETYSSKGIRDLLNLPISAKPPTDRLHADRARREMASAVSTARSTGSGRCPRTWATASDLAVAAVLAEHRAVVERDPSRRARRRRDRTTVDLDPTHAELGALQASPHHGSGRRPARSSIDTGGDRMRREDAVVVEQVVELVEDLSGRARQLDPGVERVTRRRPERRASRSGRPSSPARVVRGR